MIPSELMEVPEIAEAVDVLKDTSYTREELEQYEKYWDIVRSQQALVQDAKAKGREEGKEEGIEIGKEMGMNASRTQIALKLKSLGYPVDAIATATGLSPTEIEALVLE